MRIISTSVPVLASDDKRQIWYKPNCRYIVSDYEAYYLKASSKRSNQWTESSFNAWERRYGGQNLNGKKVCIYRHTAYGDQLMISAVPRYLKTLYPDSVIHLYCDPVMMDMWAGNVFIDNSAVPLPIPFDVATAYDYHIFYEGILESNGEPDQNNCYDDFFGMIGLDDVPPVYKRPYIQVLPTDYNWVTREGLDLSGKYMVYHLSPANKNRCYPPQQSAEFMAEFLHVYPDWRIFVVGRREHGIQFEVPLDDDRYVNLLDRTGAFRDLIPVVEKASLFVGPDSSVMHLVACFPNVPSITLWGLFRPEDRAKYYPQHHPIVGSQCPFSPCHNHDFELPREKCRQAANWKDGDQYCAALKSITPRMIVERAMEVLE